MTVCVPSFARPVSGAKCPGKWSKGQFQLCLGILSAEDECSLYGWRLMTGYYFMDGYLMNGHYFMDGLHNYYSVHLFTFLCPLMSRTYFIWTRLNAYFSLFSMTECNALWVYIFIMFCRLFQVWKCGFGIIKLIEWCLVSLNSRLLSTTAKIWGKVRLLWFALTVAASTRCCCCIQPLDVVHLFYFP